MRSSHIEALEGHMGKIVAIGGGSMLERETLDIDREVVRLSGKQRPRALFIPTASRNLT